MKKSWVSVVFRRESLAVMLDENNFTGQADIVAALRAAGFAVTQATVSRDLLAMGAIRTRQGWKVPPAPAPAEVPHGS